MSSQLASFARRILSLLSVALPGYTGRNASRTRTGNAQRSSAAHSLPRGRASAVAEAVAAQPAPAGGEDDVVEGADRGHQEDLEEGVDREDEHPGRDHLKVRDRRDEDVDGDHQRHRCSKLTEVDHRPPLGVEREPDGDEVVAGKDGKVEQVPIEVYPPVAERA